MLLGAILIFPGGSAGASSQTGYWPASHWRTAEPESQGVDSPLLTAAIDQVIEQRLGVHSLLVIRHGYHLLGSLVAASRQSELDFARRNPFGPLGIRTVVWASDAQGRTHGWGDSHRLPEDAAKIGYLYLHGGEGRGGQSLIVWPDLDTVVVILAGGNPGRIAGAIRQAIQSDRPLAPNPEACRRMLARAAQAAQEPQPEPASEMPALAAGISGVVSDFADPRRPPHRHSPAARRLRTWRLFLGVQVSDDIGHLLG